jgi:hypothetical protein
MDIRACLGNESRPGRSGRVQRRGRFVRGAFGYILAALFAAAFAFILSSRDDLQKKPAHLSPGQLSPAGLDDRAEVRLAAESGIRSGAKSPDAVRFRGEQVYPQAMAGQIAVCGQTDVSGGPGRTFVPFVVLVAANGGPNGGEDPAPRYRVTETHVAGAVADADRTYIETVARCYDGGGPQAMVHGTIASVPPLPEHPDAAWRGVPPSVSPALSGPPPQQADVASTVTPRAPARGASLAPDLLTGAPPGAFHGADVLAGGPEADVSRTVIMRQNGNIRAAPQGNTLRVAPRGTSFRVFAEAPGGWLEVGDTAPFGWVHSSMVDRH